jgi:hypothetical protein
MYSKMTFLYNNLTMVLKYDNRIRDTKIINDGDEFANYSNQGYVLSNDSQLKFDLRSEEAMAAKAAAEGKAAGAVFVNMDSHHRKGVDRSGGSRRRRPSRKYKKSKRVFRKKSRSTRRR